MRLRWTTLFQRDFDEALSFIAQNSVTGALSVWHEIEGQVAKLADYPEMGRSGSVARTRELIINRTPFIAIYRIGEAEIILLRLIHAARDWSQANEADLGELE
jgi:toxin ParE1/3/4